ncbi:MAG: DNA-directed RNA polymerase alpha subunit [Enterobacterales bacterium]|jgi:DNA-directed RNA polymerase alpha subunit
MKVITEGEYIDAISIVRTYIEQIKKETYDNESNYDVTKNPFLKVRIANCELSYRALTALRSRGVETLFDLVNYSVSDLAKTRNCGEKTVKEIVLFVDSNGLKFKSTK